MSSLSSPDCDATCVGCTGKGPKGCKECVPGYSKDSGQCTGEGRRPGLGGAATLQAAGGGRTLGTAPPADPAPPVRRDWLVKQRVFSRY